MQFLGTLYATDVFVIFPCHFAANRGQVCIRDRRKGREKMGRAGMGPQVRSMPNGQGSFPAGTPGNGVPKVILTVGTAFLGTQYSVSHSSHFCEHATT